jgi:hypothetical protein
MTGRFQIGLCFVASAVLPGLCRADMAPALPPVSFNSSIGTVDGGVNQNPVGFGAFAYNSPACSATATVTGGAAPSVSSSSSLTAAGVCTSVNFFDTGVSGQGGITYSVAAIGPNGPFEVPVDLTAFLQASVSASVTNSVSSSADAELTISSPFLQQSEGIYGPTWGAFVLLPGYCGANTIFGGMATSGPGCLSASLSLDNLVVGLVPNVEYDVTISASSSSNYYTGSGAFAGTVTSASAEVDPALAIDPGFQNASAYSLAYGPGGAGVSGPTTTPEPSYLASVGVGIGCLLLARRHRQRENSRKLSYIRDGSGIAGRDGRAPGRSSGYIAPHNQVIGRHADYVALPRLEAGDWGACLQADSSAPGASGGERGCSPAVTNRIHSRLRDAWFRRERS